MAELTQGVRFKAGFQREAAVTTVTWPAAAPAALTALLPMADIQGNDGVQKAGHRSVLSGLGPLAFDVLSQTPNVTVPFRPLRYQGFEFLWACALGQAAVVIGATTYPEVLVSGAYRHIFEIAPHLSTTVVWEAGQGQPANARKVRRGTFACDYQASVWEWLSAMVQAFTLTVTPFEVSLLVEFVAHSLSRTSAVNTVATMAKLLPPYAPAVLPDQAICRIAPYSASTPLAAADVVQVSSWTLRVENHLATTFGPRTGLFPEEWERESSGPTITLTLVFPRHTTDIWQTRWGANSVLMADCKATGPQIRNTNVNFQLNAYLPSLQVVNSQLETSGPALPSDVVQLVAIVPTAAAAGMPTMSSLSPLGLEVVNGQSQHALL